MRKQTKTVESHIFAGMEEHVRAQQEAAGAYQGELLTAELLRPIEAKRTGTGSPEEMEREAPLFFGTIHNKLF